MTRKSNYDKYPYVACGAGKRMHGGMGRPLPNCCLRAVVLSVECYPGADVDEIASELTGASCSA